MTTYDEAYSNRIVDCGTRLCSCYDDRVNDFCSYHGKYRDGSFEQSEEYKNLKLN
jgi:hypothetical protein